MKERKFLSHRLLINHSSHSSTTEPTRHRKVIFLLVSFTSQKWSSSPPHESMISHFKLLSLSLFRLFNDNAWTLLLFESSLRGRELAQFVWTHSDGTLRPIRWDLQKECLHMRMLFAIQQQQQKTTAAATKKKNIMKNKERKKRGKREHENIWMVWLLGCGEQKRINKNLKSHFTCFEVESWGCEAQARWSYSGTTRSWKIQLNAICKKPF